MRFFRAGSSTLSFSLMSIARLTFPPKLELNRPEGSFKAAPLKNVSLTTFLYVSPVQIPPLWDQTGVPGFVGFTHFHSSTISGSASLMIPRTLLSVSPRQSPSSLILLSISVEGFVSLFAILYPLHILERRSAKAHALDEAWQILRRY